MKKITLLLLSAVVAFSQSLPLPKATEAQARAGTDNNTVMTPLRTKQAIEENGGSGTVTSVNGVEPDVDGNVEIDVSAVTPSDLGSGTVISAVPATLNYANFSTGTSKTYTFSAAPVTGDILKPYYLRLTNGTASSYAVKLTAPGGVTLFSVERNAALTADGSATDATLVAGQVMTIVFTPISTTRIDVTGIPAPLVWIEEVQLTHPHQVDGAGATMNTTASAPTYGHATFSHSADQAANFVLYRMAVPFDFDSSTDLSASFSFRLGGSDTATHRYVISMADVANSASSDTATFINAINLDFAGDASGAANDRETISYTTLTSWRSSLTAGHMLLIKLARDGDATEDASTVASADMNLRIKMGHTSNENADHYSFAAGAWHFG